MLEKQLTGVGRWVWLVAAVGGVALAIFFGVLAWRMPANFPLLGRVGLIGGIVFCIGWVVLGIRIFRRGSLNLRTDTSLINGMAWVWSVFLVTIFMVGAPDSIMGLRMILSGLVFLVGGAVFLITHIVQQAELRSREKLLEIEFRLAELAEALKAQR